MLPILKRLLLKCYKGTNLLIHEGSKAIEALEQAAALGNENATKILAKVFLKLAEGIRDVNFKLAFKYVQLNYSMA